MSALTPLYLLGVLAVAAPIVFHLIRRSPRGEVPFSSLIFLTPSPPRLTRRSRLDHILLLLLRALALCLLAFAFARPFLRQQAQQVERREGAHGTPPDRVRLRWPGRRPRRIRAFNRSKSTSSSGRSVVIDSYSMPRSTHDRSIAVACAANRAR